MSPAHLRSLTAMRFINSLKRIVWALRRRDPRHSIELTSTVALGSAADSIHTHTLTHINMYPYMYFIYIRMFL